MVACLGLELGGRIWEKGFRVFDGGKLGLGFRVILARRIENEVEDGGELGDIRNWAETRFGYN